MASGKKDIVIDFRSDTVTKPTQEMLAEMVQAEVGDSVMGDDPTVLRLERHVAELFEKEAALFVPSGTMANLIAMMSHCWERGCEIIVGDKSHFNMWEQGGFSQLGGIYSRQIANKEDGSFDLKVLDSMIQDHSDAHCTKTQVICIENTQNSCGGRVLSQEWVDQVHALCVRRGGIKLHLDGARIFNAHLATGQPLSVMAKHCDSISMCFSKGLGAPVGSCLIGSKDFIKQAYRLRKALGGAMRQTGYLASCCLHGLERAPQNLARDHEHARKLMRGINENSCGLIGVDVEQVQTNIVHVKVLNSKVDLQKFVSRLELVTDDERRALNESVVVKTYSVLGQIRVVCNLNVDSAQIDLTIKKFDFVCREFLETVSN